MCSRLGNNLSVITDAIGVLSVMFFYIRVVQTVFV